MATCETSTQQDNCRHPVDSVNTALKAEDVAGYLRACGETFEQLEAIAIAQQQGGCDPFILAGAARRLAMQASVDVGEWLALIEDMAAE